MLNVYLYVKVSSFDEISPDHISLLFISIGFFGHY